jgi:riboflavin synthase
MFTGIIECLGEVKDIKTEGDNKTFVLESPVSENLKIDQSVAHNGVCLTVTAVDQNTHIVTAIRETLDKTNLSAWEIGTKVNIERCLKLGDRLDGHMVQGHVDQTGEVAMVKEGNGSWEYHINYDSALGHITVAKGSICVNGVSLTVVNSAEGSFSVAIIPFTYAHTTFQFLKQGDKVNLEFDIVGKYITALAGKYKN